MIGRTEVIPASPALRKPITQKAGQHQHHQDGFKEVMKEKLHSPSDIGDVQLHGQEGSGDVDKESAKAVDVESELLPQSGSRPPDDSLTIAHWKFVDIGAKAFAPTDSDEMDSPGFSHPIRESTFVEKALSGKVRLEPTTKGENPDSSDMSWTPSQFDTKGTVGYSEASALLLANLHQTVDSGTGTLAATASGPESADEPHQLDEAVSVTEEESVPESQQPVTSSKERARVGPDDNRTQWPAHILGSAQTSVENPGTPAEQITKHLTQVAANITAWQVTKDPGEAMSSLKFLLEPEKLGQVKVSLMRRSDGLHIAIVAGEPGTAEMLRRDRDQLSILLHAITDKGEIAGLTISSMPSGYSQEAQHVSKTSPDRNFQDPSTGSQYRQSETGHRERSFSDKETGANKAVRRVTRHEETSAPLYDRRGIIVV
jgi:hypothetical protein